MLTFNARISVDKFLSEIVPWCFLPAAGWRKQSVWSGEKAGWSCRVSEGESGHWALLAAWWLVPWPPVACGSIHLSLHLTLIQPNLSSPSRINKIQVLFILAGSHRLSAVSNTSCLPPSTSSPRPSNAPPAAITPTYSPPFGETHRGPALIPVYSNHLY